MNGLSTIPIHTHFYPTNQKIQADWKITISKWPFWEATYIGVDPVFFAWLMLALLCINIFTTVKCESREVIGLGQLKVVNALVQNSANVNQTNNCGTTLICIGSKMDNCKLWMRWFQTMLMSIKEKSANISVWRTWMQ